MREPWNKGIPHSPETIAKMSESHRGIPSWNKGIPLFDEHKAKISEALKGRPSRNKGIPLSPEHKAKIVAWNIIRLVRIGMANENL